MHNWALLVQRFSFLLVGMMKYLFNVYVIGLANKKTVTIQPGGKDQSVLFATTKTKNQGKPASLLHKSLMKKEFRRMAKAVKNQVELLNMACSLFKFVIPVYCSLNGLRWALLQLLNLSTPSGQLSLKYSKTKDL